MKDDLGISFQALTNSGVIRFFRYALDKGYITVRTDPKAFESLKLPQRIMQLAVKPLRTPDLDIRITAGMVSIKNRYQRGELIDTADRYLTGLLDATIRNRLNDSDELVIRVTRLLLDLKQLRQTLYSVYDFNPREDTGCTRTFLIGNYFYLSSQTDFIAFIESLIEFINKLQELTNIIRTDFNYLRGRN